MNGGIPLEVWGQAATAGVLAGLAATAVTVLIERCGGLVGGVIGTTPSTILAAAMGIAAGAANASDLQIALFTVPMAMACDVLLLAAWKVVPPFLPQGSSVGAKAAMLSLVSLVVWAIPAGGVWALTSLVLREAFQVVIAGTVTLVVTAIAGLAWTWQLPPSPPGSNHVGWKVLVTRGLGAGLSIFAAVLVARVSPALGGLVSAFPAIFLTTMVSVFLAQGEATTTGAVGPMILGSTSVSLFACVFAALAPGTSHWAALGSAYVIAIAGASVPATLWLRWRRSKATTGFEEVVEPAAQEDEGAVDGQSA